MFVFFEVKIFVFDSRRSLKKIRDIIIFSGIKGLSEYFF